MVSSVARSALPRRIAYGAQAGPPMIALIAWVVLNATDTLQTWLSLSVGAVEGNALLATLVGSLGLEQAMLVKLVAGVAIGCLLWRGGRRGIWWWLNGAMVGVVVWNMFVMSFTL